MDLIQSSLKSAGVIPLILAGFESGLHSLVQQSTYVYFHLNHNETYWSAVLDQTCQSAPAGVVLFKGLSGLPLRATPGLQGCITWP